MVTLKRLIALPSMLSAPASSLMAAASPGLPAAAAKPATASLRALMTASKVSRSWLM